MNEPKIAARRGIRLPALLVLAALSGLLHVLALPPHDQGWLAFVALVPLIVGIRLESRLLRLVVTGAVFGAVSVTGVVHWIPAALIEGNGFGPRATLLVTSLVFAYYTGGFALLPLAIRFVGRGALRGPAAPAFAWVVMETIRDALIPALCWTAYGHSQHDTLTTLQLAELAGSAGLSFLLVLANALVADALIRASRGLRGWPLARPALLAFGLVIGMIVTGRLRLAAEDRAGADGAAAAISSAAVQLAVPQSERWRPGRAWPRIDAFLELTAAAADAGAMLVVWPETAIEQHFDEVDGLGDAVARTFTARPGRVLLAGAPREVIEGQASRYFNSAVLLDDHGRVLDVYDKMELYPGSEYVPDWLRALPGAERVLSSQLRWAPYTEGSGDGLVVDGPVAIGVLICVEAVRPAAARARALGGAALLVHLANDAVIPGPAAAAQDFAITRFRAVETRRPLIRASNLGVSAVIAPSGRVLSRSDEAAPGIAIASVVPRSGATPFMRIGWRLPWLCVGISIVGGFVPRRPARGSPPAPQTRRPGARPAAEHPGV